MLGLPIIRDMKRIGLNYENGNILDPRDGNIYNAMMTLSPDGQTLTVRGYLGFDFLAATRSGTACRTAPQRLDPIVVAKYLPGAVKTPMAACASIGRIAKSANAYR